MNRDLAYRRQVVRQQAIADRLSRKRARQTRKRVREARRSPYSVSGRRLAVICLSLITGVSVDPSHSYGVVLAFACAGLALLALHGVGE